MNMCSRSRGQCIFRHVDMVCRCNRRYLGQSSIYFPMGDYVNATTSAVIATSHIVASHISKLLPSLRRMLLFHSRENSHRRKSAKNGQLKAISVNVLWGSFRHRGQARIQLLAKGEVVKIMENKVLLPQEANVSHRMPRKRVPQPSRIL